MNKAWRWVPTAFSTAHVSPTLSSLYISARSATYRTAVHVQGQRLYITTAMEGAATSQPATEDHTTETAPDPNPNATVVLGHLSASATASSSITAATGAGSTASQGSQHGASSGTESRTQARRPIIYHGIMEGFSVQFSDGPADPEDIAQRRQYGQYEPRTVEELQSMSRNLLLPLDAAEAPQPGNEYPIMQLPTELRLRIWEIAIADDTVDLIDYCHDPECEYEEKTDHPWYKARCFFTHLGPRIKGVLQDYHKPLVTPGINLLLVSKTIYGEVLPLVEKKRHFNIQAASLECASRIVLACPYVKSVAFPIPAFSTVLNRLSFAGKRGVQWWARHMARYLTEFPDNSVSKVIFWMGESTRSRASRHEEGMIYHRMELNDPELGKERWNIRFIGSL